MSGITTNQRSLTFSVSEPVNGVTLCSKRSYAARINGEKLAAIIGEAKTYEAVIDGEFAESQKMTGDVVNLKRGARVLFQDVLARRDDAFAEYGGPIEIEAKIEKKDGKVYITIPSPGPRRRVNVIIPKTHLEKGTEIIMRSEYGIYGDVSFISDNMAEVEPLENITVY